MKVVELKIKAAHDGEEVSGTLSVQRLRHGTWVNQQTFTVVSGLPGAERSMLLEDDERIVIEATSNVKMVYDKTQMAAVPRTVVPTSDERFVEPDSPKVAADDLDMRGPGLYEHIRREERDRMITAARQKLKQATKAETDEAG